VRGPFLGQLTDAGGQPLVVNGGIKESDLKGLWGIRFGNGQGGTDPNTLYFAAGINAEADGLFGAVAAVSSSKVPLGDHMAAQGNALEISALLASAPRAAVESGPTVSRSQDSSPVETIPDISLATDANGHPSPGQTAAPVAMLNAIAQSVRESAIDQLFGAFDAIVGS
jgi:hypothetical protein